MITYNTDGVAMPKLKKRIINRWIKQVAATYGRKVGDIGYMFVDDAKILQVNNEYLGHDYYTDIITFDYDEDNIVSGDLVISIDTVKSNAELFGKEYEDELHRVIIHGILHLCGINDKGPGEREIMEANENKALAMLKALEEKQYFCLNEVSVCAVACHLIIQHNQALKTKNMRPSTGRIFFIMSIMLLFQKFLVMQPKSS